MYIIFWLCFFIIILHYFFFPIITILYSFFKPDKIKRIESCPTVTLLIAAYNEEHIIKNKIENSLRLNYPRDKLQIIVVSNGSTDNTPKIVDSYKEMASFLFLIRLEKEKPQHLIMVSEKASERLLSFPMQTVCMNQMQ